MTESDKDLIDILRESWGAHSKQAADRLEELASENAELKLWRDENFKPWPQVYGELNDLKSENERLNLENRIFINALSAIKTANSFFPGPSFMGLAEKLQLLASEALEKKG